MKETLVSCFFNLKKMDNEPKERKGMEQYMKDGQFVLALKKPLVLFVDKDVAVECQMIRNRYRLDKMTKIIPMDIKELPYYELLPQFVSCREKYPMLNGSPTKDTPLYTLLTWCKLAFMKRVVDENPFHSTHFGWIDFGIAYVANLKHVTMNTFSNFPDKIKLLSLRNLLAEDLSPHNTDFQGNKVEFVKKHYLSMERGIVAAGFMTGGSKEWTLFHTLFEKEALKYLKEGFAGSEQQIIPIIMLQNPSLFLTYRGDYDAILANHHHFRMSLHNVNRYTLKRARETKRNVNVAIKAGVEVYKSIFPQTEGGVSHYDWKAEDPIHLLVFMNELYALFIFQNITSSADKLFQQYQKLFTEGEQKEAYQEARTRLEEEFFPC